MPDVAIQATISLQSATSNVLSRSRGVASSVSSVVVATSTAYLLCSCTSTLSSVTSTSIVAGIVQRMSSALSAITSVTSDTLINAKASALSSVIGTLNCSLARTRNIVSSISGNASTQVSMKRLFSETITLSALCFSDATAVNSMVMAATLSGISSAQSGLDESFVGAINGSTRIITSKLELFFDGLSEAPVTLTSDDIVSVSLLEEIKMDNELPLGTASANTLSISILNSNGLFTPTNTASIYYGKLVPKVPIKAYCVVDVGGQSVEVPLGTFYSGDWTSPTDKIVTSVVCYDRLYSLSKEILPSIKVQSNTTLYDLFELVFTLLGLTQASYVIDQALKIPVPIGWLPKGTVGNALSWLSEAGLCFVFMDRQNVIQVSRLDFTRSSDYSITDDDQVITSDIPTRYESIYSTLILNKHTAFMNQSEKVLELTDITIPNGTTTYTAAAFSNGPVCLIDYASVIGTTNVSINILSYSAWDIDFEIVNTGLEEKGNIVVYGREVATTILPSTIDSTTIKSIIGEKVLTVNNELVQDSSYASEYATMMFGYITNPNGVITASIRGNPKISLGDKVTVVDSSNLVSTVDAIVSRINTTIESGLQSTLEGVVVQ